MPSCASPRRLVSVPDPQDDAVRGLLDLAADSAPDVAAHMERTARLAKALVHRLELGEPLARIVVLTARLHDVGKLGIPPWVLEKPGPLSRVELQLMREHSLIGQAMLERRRELLAMGPLVRAAELQRFDVDHGRSRRAGRLRGDAIRPRCGGCLPRAARGPI
jgi:hypothetical protein